MRSNPGRVYGNERSTIISFSWTARHWTKAMAAMSAPLRRAQSRAMVVHLRCHLLLRNHKDVGSLFSSNLGDGEGVLWQFSGDDEDTYWGGGACRSFRSSWFGTSGKESMRRRAGLSSLLALGKSCWGGGRREGSFIGLRVLAWAEQRSKSFLQPNQRFFKSSLWFDTNLILSSFRFASVPS
jgi:hypothetical protein